MTCSHCATFHNTTYPELKKKYIDTGKVRYILREFPLDPLAAGGFMLARCAGNDKYYPMVEMLFQQAEGMGGRRTRSRRCWRSPSRPASPRKASNPA